MRVTLPLDFDALPDEIPVFPLDGVLLLPRGDLPLNIFEPRYMAMVDAALGTHRLIGIIQPSPQAVAERHPLFKIGCVGRITRFEETDDGRYIINLHGLCRFRIIKELALHQGGFRQMRVTWGPFQGDMERIGCLDIDRSRLIALLKEYFDRQGMHLDWALIDQIADEGLMTTLAMVCPFTVSEKQALLEASCCRTRASLFINLLEMALREGYVSSQRPH